MPIRLIVIAEDASGVGHYLDVLKDQGIRMTVEKDDAVVLDPNHGDPPTIMLIEMVGRVAKDHLYLRSMHRKHPFVPIIAKHASNDPDEQAVLVELGADACFHEDAPVHELVAKTRALGRRQTLTAMYLKHAPEKAVADGSTILFADWRLDTANLVLFAPNGELVPLTMTELRVFTNLVSRSDGFFGRKDFLESGVVSGDSDDDRMLDVYMSRIRKKLANYSNLPVIETVRGRGYRLIPEVTRL